MKRLFCIMLGDRKLPGPDGKTLYFEVKDEAKVIRDELIRNGAKVHIGLGPDHKRYNGGASA